MCCGPGLYLERLAKLGHDCVGIDFSPASIEHAQNRSASLGLEIDYQLGDIRSVDYGAEYEKQGDKKCLTPQYAYFE